MSTKIHIGFDSHKDLVGRDYDYSVSHDHFDIEDILQGAHSKSNFITLFYSLPEIFAPINEIASRVADARWILKSFSTDEVDWKNKKFNSLFTKPNPLMSMKEYVWQCVCYELLTGACFQSVNIPSSLERKFDNIVGIMNVPTNQMVIDKNNNVDPYTADSLTDFVKSYYIVRKDGSKRHFDIDNIIPIMHHDLHHGNEVDKFKSALTGAKLPIRNLIPVYEARNVIYVKRGALGFLVSKKSDESGLVSLTKKEKEESQREFQSTYGLSNHKNQVGVSSAPVEYISTSMSIRDLEPFEETLADAVAIYKVLRVPRHLVPSKDQSTFSNADSDMKSFYNDVIIPLAEKYAQEWTSEFNIPDRYIEPNFDHISFLQENRKERADVSKVEGETWLQRWKNGVCTLNDWITATDGFKGTGVIYDKKLFEMTPEEVEQVNSILNNKFKQNEPTPENTGAQD